MIFPVCIYFGINNLHATLVCVACSQLEKLKLALLDIRQTQIISEHHYGDEMQPADIHQQPNLSDESFRHMQEQLNSCIRHHQQIQRWVIKSNQIKIRVIVMIVEFEHFFSFQTHGSIRGYNESPSVRTTLYIPINNVPWRFLHRYGKISSSVMITRWSLPEINNNFLHIKEDSLS